MTQKLTLIRKGNDNIFLNQERNCYICNQNFQFDEYKEIYHYLGTLYNPVESFFNLLEKKCNSLYFSRINLAKYWKKLTNKVLCPQCLLNLNQAHKLTRSCFKCGKNITFNECYLTKFNKGYSREDLMSHWINPILQFFCCSCYKKMVQTSK